MSKIINWYKDFNEKHKKFCEFARFFITGGIATVIDMFIMGIVLYIFDPDLYPKFYNVWIGGGEPSTLATVIGTGTGFVISLVCNYFMSIFLVFNNKGNSRTAKGAILFFILATIGLFINMAGMWLGYDILGINEWITKIIMTLIVLVYNFTTRKLLIFKKDNKTEENVPNTENVKNEENEAVQSTSK